MQMEVLLTILGFCAAIIVNWAVDKFKKSDDTFKDEMKKNTEAIMQLTLAIQRAEIEIKHLAEKVVSIPEIQKDLNLLGDKVRRMGNNQ